MAPEDDIPLPPEPVDEEDIPVPDPGFDGPPAAPAPEPEQPEPQVGPTVEDIRARWQDIRTAVRGHTAVFEVMLSGASVQSVDGNTVVIGHDSEPLVARLSDPRGTRVLREALHEVFKTDLDVRCVHAPGGAAAAAPQRGNPGRPAAPKQTYSRPSRARDQSAQPAAQQAPVEEPEEPEPPRADEEIPDDERAEMVADAHSGPTESRLDPDKVAMELLQSELGARPLDTGDG